MVLNYLLNPSCVTANFYWDKFVYVMICENNTKRKLPFMHTVACSQSVSLTDRTCHYSEGFYLPVSMWERCWSSLEPGWTPTVTFFLLYLLIQQHVMEMMTTTATRVPAATPRYSPPLQVKGTTPSLVGQNYTYRHVHVAGSGGGGQGDNPASFFFKSLFI